MKVGVLLINLGTPDRPTVKDVRKYLTQFLSDPLVIDIHPLARFFLVNFIIVPFRSRKSAGLYKKIWTKEGSPLLVHTKKMALKLQSVLNNRNPPAGNSIKENSFFVEYGMRYQNPGIQPAFKKLLRSGVEKIIAIPLFPQYASSTTGSAIGNLKDIMKKEGFSEVKIIEHFFRNRLFIDAWSEVAEKYLSDLRRKNESYDFFLFSYHGLPEQQVINECNQRGGRCKSIKDCENGLLPAGSCHPYCYRNACFETTRQLAGRLGIPEGKHTTSFQSRFGGRWLKPFSDRVVAELAQKGIKKLLVFSPSFVADCLETNHEIAVGYSEVFRQNGGEKLQLAESLNDSDAWIKTLESLVNGNV